jgi:hypothetical protein
MFSKEELFKLLLYFIAAITASLIRFLRNTGKKTPSLFVVEMLTGASFAFFIVPAVVDHFHLSLYYGTGITWILTMLSESVLRKIESKLNKKVDDVADTIDQ